MAQILTATAQPVILPEAYKDFEDVFSIENAGYLAPHLFLWHTYLPTQVS